MDSKKCVLCQADGEVFVDFLRSRNLDVEGYSKLVANIKSFVDRTLLLPVDCTTSLNDLNGDNNIASNCLKVKAKLHKAYALKVSSSKLKKGFV